MKEPATSSAKLAASGLAITAAIVGVFLLLAWGARREARDRFFEQYNAQQLVLAKQASNTIEQLFAAVQLDLTLAGRLLADVPIDPSHRERIGLELRKIYVSSDAVSPVVELVVFDRFGTAVGMSPEDAYTIGRDYSWREYFHWAKEEGRPGVMHLSPFMKMEGGRLRGSKALMAVHALYDAEGGFNGVVGGLVNFDELARSHILSIRLGQSGYAWLLDNDASSILVDPNQRVSGLTYEQAFLPRWEKLFELATSTREGKPGTDWYDFEEPGRPENTVRKLVAHAPVRVGDRLWTIGVCTPAPEVETIIGSLQSRQTWLAALSIGVTLLGVTIIVALLMTWNSLLRSEVLERTKDLSEAREALEAAFDELLAERKNSALGRLALGLAHEIRNPLFSISMNMQMLRRKVRPEGLVDESFSIVDGEVQRLNRLIGQVMGFARPAALKIAPTDTAALAGGILAMLKDRFVQEEIEVEANLAGAPVILCDPDQVRQILWNLILNALEAMGESKGVKRLTVRLSCDEERGMAAMEVGDTGCGISPEDIAKVFDPFFTTKAQGGGLGLSIAMTIANRHDGTVEACGKPGGGTLFTVRLPLGGPSAPPGQPGQTVGEGARDGA